MSVQQVDERLPRTRLGPTWALTIGTLLTRWVTICLFISLAVVILRPLFPARLLAVPLDVLGILNVPIAGSLLTIVLLFVVSNGLARHKRAALWFAVVVWQGPWVAGLPAAISARNWLEIASGIVAVPIIVVLIASRRAFPAKLARGSWLFAGLVLLVGWIVVWTLTFLALEFMPHHGHHWLDRVTWAVWASLGITPADAVSWMHPVGPSFLSNFAGLLTGLVVMLALWIWLSPQGKVQVRSEKDELAVRRLMLEHDSDSLSYFATRDDRRAVFSRNGRAAVSYKVIGGVALAAGDPIGAQDSWDEAIGLFSDLTRAEGLACAVISTGPAGAKAYRKAGMGVITMGDEAIIACRDFDLNGPAMRPVRQAVDRAQKAGYTVQLRRQAEIGEDELARLVALAAAWRRGGDERGYSMALERLGSGRDPSLLWVTAHDKDESPVGLLTFVPWGRRGVSLDTMRRSPDAVSGVTELMVTRVALEGPQIGVERFSLNFAMFRGVFEQGESVAANWSQRVARRVLLFASRWWQLESLYVSNDKYRPTWTPRYLCYSATAQLTQIIMASGRAEGFLPDVGRKVPAPVVVESPALSAAVVSQERSLLAVQAAPLRRTDQEKTRIAKLDRLRAAGIDPYPPSVPRTDEVADVNADRLGQTVSIAGRVVALRDLGGVIFAVLRENDAQVQVFLTADRPAGTGKRALRLWHALVDLGDRVSVTGEIARSRSGELSVHVDAWTMAAKAVAPFPDKRRGLTAAESKIRLRHMGMALDSSTSRTLRGRSVAVQAVRTELWRAGFIEVETPILQRVHGGANARPFVTHINAYDTDLYLRIAPELFLKRMAVGGFEKVFEVGRNFRNEGADATHNPEFTSLEAYQAFGDYTTMRTLIRDVILAAAVAVHGEPIARRPEGDVRLDVEWPVVTLHEAVSAAMREPITLDTPLERLRDLADSHDVHWDANRTAGEVVCALYDDLVEHTITLPTFVSDFPVEASPLSRTHRTEPRLSERWDLVAFGAELGCAYTELIDPLDQRRRLTEQSLLAAAGDPEAMEVDDEFLRAMEFTMPPTGGLGLGIDRMYMMLIGASIRETLAFPFVKPNR